MPFDMFLVAKGMTVSREALLDQALYSLGIEKKYRPFLLRSGWTLDDSEGMQHTYDYLLTAIPTAHEARTESKLNTQAEQAAITEAKTFKRAFVNAMKVLRNKGQIPAVDYEFVRNSGALERSTPKILAYFAKINNHVAKYDTQLAPFFGGESPVVLFNQVRDRLAAAQQKQEMTLEALPQETLRIYEAMGRLLQYIENLNTIARIAFDGQADIIAEFNKDRLLRGRKRRSKSAVEPVGNAGGDDAASEKAS